MRKKRLLIILAALLIMSLMVSGLVFAEPVETDAAAEAETDAAAEEVVLADGSYTGTAEVPVSVKITVENGTITDVVITDVKAAGKDEEPNPNVDQTAIETLTQQVMDAQSADIEGVEGAEALTAAVKSAVADAL